MFIWSYFATWPSLDKACSTVYPPTPVTLYKEWILKRKSSYIMLLHCNSDYSPSKSNWSYGKVYIFLLIKLVVDFDHQPHGRQYIMHSWLLLHLIYKTVSVPPKSVYLEDLVNVQELNLHSIKDLSLGEMCMHFRHPPPHGFSPAESFVYYIWEASSVTASWKNTALINWSCLQAEEMTDSKHWCHFIKTIVHIVTNQTVIYFTPSLYHDNAIGGSLWHDKLDSLSSFDVNQWFQLSVSGR